MKAEVIYQAKRSLFERANASLNEGSTKYSPEAVSDIFDGMRELFPSGAKISATYYKSVATDEPVTIEGTVAYSVKMDDCEPYFEIETPSGEFILLKGSLLTMLG